MEQHAASVGSTAPGPAGESSALTAEWASTTVTQLDADTGAGVSSSSADVTSVARSSARRASTWTGAPTGPSPSRA